MSYRDYTACKLVRVIDGDTVELDIDVGFHCTVRERFRLLGVNCPEVHGATKAAGEKATAFTLGWFYDHTDFEVRTFKARDQDKYGRWLAEITSPDGTDSLNDALLASGNAVPMSDTGSAA